MLRSADFEQLLRDQDVAEKVAIKRETNVTDEQPDQVVFLNVGPGPGLSYDGEFERTSLQVRCRGKQNDPDSAGDLAAQVDKILMGLQPPITIGGRHVTYVDYLGGPPAFLALDEARRTMFYATYVVEIERE